MPQFHRGAFFLFNNKNRYNWYMEQNFSKDYWKKPCPSVKCAKPAEGLLFVSIPANLGDDREGSPVAPKNGEHSNAIVKYEANGAVYIYSAEGIPVNVKEGI